MKLAQNVRLLPQKPFSSICINSINFHPSLGGVQVRHSIWRCKMYYHHLTCSVIIVYVSQVFYFLIIRWPQNYKNQVATVYHTHGVSRKVVYGEKVDFGVKIRL